MKIIIADDSAINLNLIHKQFFINYDKKINNNKNLSIQKVNEEKNQENDNLPVERFDIAENGKEVVQNIWIIYMTLLYNRYQYANIGWIWCYKND